MPATRRALHERDTAICAAASKTGTREENISRLLDPPLFPVLFLADTELERPRPTVIALSRERTARRRNRATRRGSQGKGRQPLSGCARRGLSFSLHSSPPFRNYTRARADGKTAIEMGNKRAEPSLVNFYSPSFATFGRFNGLL